MKKLSLSKKESKKMLCQMGIGIGAGAASAFYLLMMGAQAHVDLSSDFVKNYIAIASCSIGTLMIPISSIFFKQKMDEKIDKKRKI